MIVWHKNAFYTTGWLEKWINIFIENPFKTWWNARKYFKRPKLHFRFIFCPYIKPDFEYLNKKIKERPYIDERKESIEHIKDLINRHSYHYNCPYISYDYMGRILDIKMSDVQWKDKFNSPRHERSPYIYFCLFKLIGFSINFYIPKYNEFGERENGDMEYWEYLLDYLYYTKSLKINSCWQYDSKIYRTRVTYGNAEDGSEDKFEPYRQIIQTHLFSLNKTGLKEFKKLYINK